MTNQALDDGQRQDVETEMRRPENQVAHAFYTFLNASNELIRIFKNESTRRLAAMEERDGNEVEDKLQELVRARMGAMWRLAIEEHGGES